MANIPVFHRRLGAIILVLLLGALVWYAAHVLLLLFASIMLAILWRGTASWLSSRSGMPKKWSIPLVVFVMFGAVVLAFVLMAPSVAEQAETLRAELPQLIENLRAQVQKNALGRQVLQRLPAEQQIIDGQEGVQQMVGFFGVTFNILVDVLVVLVLATFLTADPRLYTRGLVRLAPIPNRQRAREVLATLYGVLYRWFIGKILDMLTVGIMTAIGLWLLGMPLVLTFAVIAFFLSFIPNIGPVLSAVPPLLVALTVSPSQALYVGLLYLGIQVFESYFITPNIQKHAIKMPPVLLLLVQVFFALKFGVLALLLATPILATVIVLVNMLYIEDTLGDRKEPIEEEVLAPAEAAS